VKLPAHRAGLPGKVISFYIVPLDPAYKAGLAGHVPVNYFYIAFFTLKYVRRESIARITRISLCATANKAF
jgi:hypothetical protein